MNARRLPGFNSATIRFSFDGRSLEGRQGDTIASALLANNFAIIGRSFKYHRPRGIFGSWSEEPNAIVDVTIDGKTTPNLRATTERLVDGMEVRSVNSAPSAARDRSALLDRFARFLPAGFYYKTFILPDWHLFEPRIRAMAGLGRVDPTNEPAADCAVFHQSCDLLVIGAGPAGLAAACAAADAGRKVMLVDERAEAGGTLGWCDVEIDGMGGADWGQLQLSRLRAAGHQVLLNSTAFGTYDHDLVSVWQRRETGGDALWQLRPGEIILAAGAIERPLVFADNDRPGVMLAEAALFYLRQHGILVGSEIVLATNNDRSLLVARALRDAGATVTIADLRQGARIEGVGWHGGIEHVLVNGRKIAADCLLVSGGYTPSVHLFCQAKGKLRLDETIAAFVPDNAVNRTMSPMRIVGAANGEMDIDAAIASGFSAGGGKGKAPAVTEGIQRYHVGAAWPEPGGKTRAWIDLQNDVTLKDVELAARENFRSVEHLKRYTTLGMATDQGKTSNMNGLAAMAAITGRGIAETGTTTYRPPFVPVPFTVIAGRRRGELMNPVRRLTLENEHKAAGAVFREYGGWLRPAHYGAQFGIEDWAEAIQAEALRARQTVGILDGSPLGKIEVMGPLASALMDFNSYQTISTLKPGRIRYGFMLTEAGVIYDDGVVSKVSDEHFIVSCSSGHVQGVYMRLEEWRQDQFDPDQVYIHNSTPQWATLTATGPASRELVAGLGLGIDLDDPALPHMSFREGQFAGAAARVARVSFTGDRSYEVSVPQSMAAALLSAMREGAAKLGGCLLGSEALLLLRAEKGYIIAGKDTDGTTMPHDLGITGPRDKRQNEYVGKRSLFTENAMREGRLQAVGLTVDAGKAALPTGAHLIETVSGKHRSAGFVTSSYWSPVLGRPIALALVENGLSRLGQSVELYHLGKSKTARISPVCAFDPEGKRLNG
ncbi:MAG: (2Fe-2S)-binding protein [Nitratireductor sp.]|nr:(2Fe-2S)-binding protein [Nitratireductor sp.]